MFHLPNLTQVLYKILQPYLFQLDPEDAHNWMMQRLQKLASYPGLSRWLFEPLQVKESRLTVSMDNLTFPNPVGLAAGFDKGADLLNILPLFGFGFLEVGTFTPHYQEGQPQPRLFRYKKEQALINRMGFNNPGVSILTDRFHDRALGTYCPVGINLGKGKLTPNDKAIEDYQAAFRQAVPYADYLVMNVSSPNTPGLRDLQTTPQLKNILTEIHKLNPQSKRVFLKVAPDLHLDTLQEIASLCVDQKVGLIATNTTLDHALLGRASTEKGGLSGAPLKKKADEVLGRIYQITQGRVPLIGVGGIFSAQDAYDKIRLGANLVQVYTGWVYKGPGLVPAINKGLLARLENDGFQTLQDAVGTAH